METPAASFNASSLTVRFDEAPALLSPGDPDPATEANLAAATGHRGLRTWQWVGVAMGTFFIVLGIIVSR